MVSTTQGKSEFSHNSTYSTLITFYRILKNKTSGFKTNSDMRIQRKKSDIRSAPTPALSKSVSKST